MPCLYVRATRLCAGRETPRKTTGKRAWKISSSWPWLVKYIGMSSSLEVSGSWSSFGKGGKSGCLAFFSLFFFTRPCPERRRKKVRGSGRKRPVRDQTARRHAGEEIRVRCWDQSYIEGVRKRRQASRGRPLIHLRELPIDAFGEGSGVHPAGRAKVRWCNTCTIASLDTTNYALHLLGQSLVSPTFFLDEFRHHFLLRLLGVDGPIVGEEKGKKSQPAAPPNTRKGSRCNLLYETTPLDSCPWSHPRFVLGMVALGRSNSRGHGERCVPCHCCRCIEVCVFVTAHHDPSYYFPAYVLLEP